MRVIAGSARGRKLRSLRGLAMRPTQDRVREALFNIIGEAVIDSSFLDLYAGVGGVGIEALSRGAASVVFVENHPPAVEVIRNNLTACGFSSGFCVVKSDALRFIDGAARRAEKFQIIYIDPPYRTPLLQRTLQKLGAAHIIAAGGLVVAEHASAEQLAEKYGDLLLQDLRRFGDTALSFFTLQNAGQNARSQETRHTN